MRNDKKNVKKGGEWQSTGGVVMRIEFDKRILRELHEIAEADGVGSVYQMIRNACYAYVNSRKEAAANNTDPEKGPVFIDEE